MDRRTRLLVIATAIAVASGYLFFMTSHTQIAFIAMIAAVWLGIEAVFPHVK
jgi:hypothetical protein